MTIKITKKKTVVATMQKEFRKVTRQRNHNDLNEQQLQSTPKSEDQTSTVARSII